MKIVISIIAIRHLVFKNVTTSYNASFPSLNYLWLGSYFAYCLEKAYLLMEKVFVCNNTLANAK